MLCFARIPECSDHPARNFRRGIRSFFVQTEFDEGFLARDVLKAAEEIISILAIFDDTHPFIPAEENGLRHLIQAVWKKFQPV